MVFQHFLWWGRLPLKESYYDRRSLCLPEPDINDTRSNSIRQLEENALHSLISRSPTECRTHYNTLCTTFISKIPCKLQLYIFPSSFQESKHRPFIGCSVWSSVTDEGNCVLFAGLQESQAKQAPLWLRGRRPAGRNAAAPDDHIWASNARQDTTLDTLQKALI